MPIKNKALLLLTSILTANAFTLNAFAMRDKDKDDNYSVISEINDSFAELEDNNAVYDQIFYNIGDIKYQDLLNLYKNNKPNLIKNEFGVFNESGIVNKNNNHRNERFIRILQDNLKYITQGDCEKFLSVMKPTFDRFGISIDYGNIKGFANASINSTILDDIINNREFSTNTIMSVILSHYLNKDNKSDFDNFLIKLKILSLDVNNKFDLFCNLCQQYSSNIKQGNNSLNNVFNSIIPALANMVLYEVNNASEYNDNTDAIVCNVLSTMTQLHKYNNDIDLIELNRNIVEYITSMNYDDNDFNDAQFANNHLAINLMYYYNRTLNGIINSTNKNFKIDLFDNNIAEHLKTVSENVIAHYVDLNGMNSVDQRILASFSIDDSYNNIEAENLIEMQESIINHNNNKKKLQLVELLNLVADTNAYNYENYRSGKYNFAQFRNDFRKSKNSTQSLSTCVNNVEDLVYAMSNNEKYISISNPLYRELVSGKQHKNYDKRILQIIARNTARQRNQNILLMNEENVRQIFSGILQGHAEIESVKEFTKYIKINHEKELIITLMKTPQEEVSNVIKDYLDKICSEYLNQGVLFFQKYLNWFTKYSNFAKTCGAKYDSYSGVASNLRGFIQTEIKNEYAECRNGNKPDVIIQSIIAFCNKYNNHNENKFKQDIINPNRVNGTAGEKEIIAGFTSQFWEGNNIAQFRKYKEVNKLLSSVLQCNDTEVRYDNGELLHQLLNSNDLFVFDLEDTQDLPETINNKYKKYFDEMKELILEVTKYNKNLDTQKRNEFASLLCDKVASFFKEVNDFINKNNDSNTLNIKIDSDYAIYNCAQKFIKFILTHDYESCNEIFGQINALQFVRIMKMIESSDNDELSIQQYRSYLLQSAILNICDNVNNCGDLLNELYNNVDNIKRLSYSINKIKTLDINNSNDIRLLNYLGEKKTVQKHIEKFQKIVKQYNDVKEQRQSLNVGDIVTNLNKLCVINNKQFENKTNNALNKKYKKLVIDKNNAPNKKYKLNKGMEKKYNNLFINKKLNPNNIKNNNNQFLNDISKIYKSDNNENADNSSSMNNILDNHKNDNFGSNSEYLFDMSD